MPIFESSEAITQSEMKRQQEALNAKVKRMEFKDSYKQMCFDVAGHQNGDCWEDEPDDQGKS